MQGWFVFGTTYNIAPIPLIDFTMWLASAQYMVPAVFSE